MARAMSESIRQDTCAAAICQRPKQSTVRRDQLRQPLDAYFGQRLEMSMQARELVFYLPASAVCSRRWAMG